MLTLNFGGQEFYDHHENVFYNSPNEFYNFEHSLRAIAKWESKWLKPFLDGEPKEAEEFWSYIECMALDGVPDQRKFTEQHLQEITSYISGNLTATTIKKLPGGKSSGSYVTSEVLYAQMCVAGVNWEAQDWHISRLQKVLEVINDMQSDKKKMNSRDVLKQNAQLNAERRKALNSKG